MMMMMMMMMTILMVMVMHDMTGNHLDVTDDCYYSEGGCLVDLEAGAKGRSGGWMSYYVVSFRQAPSYAYPLDMNYPGIAWQNITLKMGPRVDVLLCGLFQTSPGLCVLTGYVLPRNSSAEYNLEVGTKGGCLIMWSLSDKPRPMRTHWICTTQE